jgi:hypothetical protein
MQMSSTILDAGMSKFANLNEIDLLAVIIGAFCHDFKHDGFNN